MTRPVYVRATKHHIWHLVDWQDRKYCLAAGPWVYCGAPAEWFEITKSPDRVCKRCLNRARASIEYLEAALKGAEAGT